MLDTKMDFQTWVTEVIRDADVVIQAAGPESASIRRWDPKAADAFDEVTKRLVNLVTYLRRRVVA